MQAATVICRTPTPGKSAKRIAKPRFDLVRRAVLRVIPKRGDGIAFADLAGLVAARLTPAERRTLGSILWYVTTVKLELEVRGELERVAGDGPQHLRRRVDLR